ncbi:MAG: dTDP-4-dehydrorhamnose reductase, partial [candidate division Zixibacteria bacterium]|nr:dTDP-4-dehydrorhamnose reductase [candidate division Zixibacteria bacterium]
MEGNVSIKRVLVTGGRGMLGQDLCSIFSDNGCIVKQTDIDDMDVRKYDLISQTIDECQPEIILHLAALTDVDGCEREPEDSYHTNAVGTKNVALAAQSYQLPVVYISTGSVFNGDKQEPYHEFDDPDPKSVYARSKLAGENFIRELTDEFYIVRAGWMFGGGPLDKKFVAKMIDIAKKYGKLQAVNDKFGTPTYTADFASGIYNLIKTGRFGTYHMGNTGWCSRLEMAEKIVEYAGLEDCPVIGVNSAQFPLAAHRPRMEAIDSLHCRLEGF